MTKYSYKKYGFMEVEHPVEGKYKKRKNIPPFEAVPMKVWAIQLKTSHSLISVAPRFSVLIFDTESDAIKHLASLKDKDNHQIKKYILTTEGYIKNRVMKALSKVRK